MTGGLEAAAATEREGSRRRDPLWLTLAKGGENAALCCQGKDGWTVDVAGRSAEQGLARPQADATAAALGRILAAAG